MKTRILCAREKQNFISKKVGLVVKVQKIKYMMMSCQQDTGQNNKIKTANKLVENVARLKYLGNALTNQNYVDKEIKSTLNEEIPACYHLALNILSSLLPKNLEFKTYRTIICLDVHGSVHHNTNRIETTNKMRSCSRIYYSDVS